MEKYDREFVCLCGYRMKESKMNTQHCPECDEWMHPVEYVTIVSHGDLDGIISAALRCEKLSPAAKVQFVFTQPFLVNTVVIAPETEKVFVCDIAINNRDPQMTADFYKRIEDRLVEWDDHHQGWEHDNPRLKSNGGKVFSSGSRACAEMLGGQDDIRVQDAIVADTREGVLSEQGQLIESAINADPTNDDVRLAATLLLCGNELMREVVETAAEVYAAVMEETERLAQEFHIDGRAMPVRSSKMYRDESSHGVVAVCDASEAKSVFSLTNLLLKGQEYARFAVVQHVSVHNGDKLVTIATKSGVNLVKLFELPSGAPFRVSLPAEKLEEVVEKLHNLSG